MAEEKYALITGATGGIGKAITLNMLKNNYSVILVGRSINKLNALRDEIKNSMNDVTVKIFSCDVSDSNAVTLLVDKISDFGIKISVLINGAGISGGGITENIDYDYWRNVINTNLNGPFYVIKEVLSRNLILKNGRIINIASTGGKQGVIYGAPYCASKHGLVGFTKALGLELAKNKSGITVNAICPGFVETEMAERVREHYSKIWGTDDEETKRRVEDRVPIGRYIEPQEVADMVSYIASKQAAGITAQAINLCGGLGNY